MDCEVDNKRAHHRVSNLQTQVSQTIECFP
jgi:hypothetical protein